MHGSPKQSTFLLVIVITRYVQSTFKGVGRNYRIAKCTAANCALRAIKKQSSNVSGAGQRSQMSSIQH